MPAAPWMTRNVGCPESRSESKAQSACLRRPEHQTPPSLYRVQIQILLHLLKLSLPGRCPCAPVQPVPVHSSHARKRRRRAQLQSSGDDDDDDVFGDGKVETTSRNILEDRVEGLMDRLVLWQMALPDAEANADGTKTVRDWTQVFCDDVVQPA